MLIGYARVTDDDDARETQRAALHALGVAPSSVHLDTGLRGTNRARPGLTTATDACRAGDELVVTKLSHLARSIADLHAITITLRDNGTILNVGGTRHDPNTPTGSAFFDTLAMVADFETELLSTRTKEGMAAARDKGRLRGRTPKLSNRQQQRFQALHATGNYSMEELCTRFNISRTTAYRTLRTEVTTPTIKRDDSARSTRDRGRNSKLTTQQHTEIAALYATGEHTHVTLAARFNVSPATISRTIRLTPYKRPQH